MLFYLLPQSFYTYIFLVRRQLTSLPVLYDQPSEIGAGVYLLLIAQLVAAALFVIPLDELLQRAMVSILGSRCSLPLAAASPLVGSHFPYHHQHWLWPRVRRCHDRVSFYLLFTWKDKGMLFVRHSGATAYPTSWAGSRLPLYSPPLPTYRASVSIPVRWSHFRGCLLGQIALHVQHARHAPIRTHIQRIHCLRKYTHILRHGFDSGYSWVRVSAVAG